MSMYSFSDRHNGPKSSEIVAMLEAVGVSSIDALIDKTVPSSIRLKKPLKVSESRTEFEYLSHLRTLAAKNKLYKSKIRKAKSIMEVTAYTAILLMKEEDVNDAPPVVRE